MFSSFKVHDISCVCVGVEGNELFLVGRTVNYVVAQLCTFNLRQSYA